MPNLNYSSFLHLDKNNIKSHKSISSNTAKKYNLSIENHIIYVSTLFESIHDQNIKFINFLPNNFQYDFSLKQWITRLMTNEPNIGDDFQIIDDRDGNKCINRLKEVLGVFPGVSESLKEFKSKSEIFFEIRFNDIVLMKRGRFRVFGFYLPKYPTEIYLVLVDIYHLISDDGTNYDNYSQKCIESKIKDHDIVQKYIDEVPIIDVDNFSNLHK